MHLEIRADDEDLRTYAAQTMLCLPSFVQNNDYLQTEIIAKVVQLANGRFVVN